MTIKIALLGFGTVAKGIPYLLKENQHKLLSLEGEDIVIDKVLVRDNESRQRFINHRDKYYSSRSTNWYCSGINGGDWAS